MDSGLLFSCHKFRCSKLLVQHQSITEFGWQAAVLRAMLTRRAVKVAADVYLSNASCNSKAWGYLLQAHDLVSTVVRRITYSTFEAAKITSSQGAGKMTLAEDLACLVEESSDLKERRPRSRMELKRFLEHRIKKKVKEQYLDGKFHSLLMNVIADQETLKDAYNCIRLNSNADIIEDSCDVNFESMAEELHCGNFDVSANIFCISTKGPQKEKETLVLPKVKLKIVQEAIRIVLEVVYKPHFSKISHGCRSGRGHHTALKYISKKLSHGHWCFALSIQQKVDSGVLANLISMMEVEIEDASLFHFIRVMFDACVLNFEFGGFSKGHGLPQEGVLSPIFLNIYLAKFDREFSKLSLKYEALEPGLEGRGEERSSYMRSWFRRQLKDHNNNEIGENPDLRIHCCRFMDELFFVISGCKETALSLKFEVENYLLNSLQLNVGDEAEILPCTGPQAIRFVGSLFQMERSPAIQASHKLMEKVSLFASQKQEAWDIGTLRIGKKWLAQGLKKVKESEIKHLADRSPLLSQISCFRKDGMKTDHWYKLLIKIWMQDVNAKSAKSEEQILSKFIAEPAIPQELKDSFYKFQKCVENYIQSETNKTLALLSTPRSLSNRTNFRVIAPVNVIRKRMRRYGLTTSKGHSCMVPELILLDHNQIIDWFSGIVQRLRSWYRHCDNFTELELTVGDQVRKSCIRTLAVKYRIHESVIERRFDSELCKLLPGGDAEQEKENDISNISAIDTDEGLMYGISYSGQCLLSLARMVSESRPCNCFVMGCSAAAKSVYTLHVMERQKFPGWKTGFSTCIHPSLNRRRIGLCGKHLKDLCRGSISLQCIDFSSWK